MNMAPLALVADLATNGPTCIASKLGHQMAPLALVADLATRGHWFKIWSSAGATFSNKFRAQTESLK